MRHAEKLKAAATNAGMGFIYKSSLTRRIAPLFLLPGAWGLDEGLAILSAVRAQIGCPVLTDVHLPQHCAPVAEIVDMLQIPAFLCRQTDLLIAAAQTKAAINVKKGQFLAPWDMRHVVEKITSSVALASCLPSAAPVWLQHTHHGHARAPADAGF